MSEQDVTFDPRIADWLEGDPNQAPDQALQIVLAAIPSIKQRRAARVLWRFSDMTTTFKLVLGAAAFVAVVLGGAFILGPPSSAPNVGGQPIPTPSPTASAAATASPTPAPTPIDTARWVTFASDRYGYSMKIPPNWTARQSERAWSLGTTDGADWLTTAADGFTAADGSIYFSVFAAPIPKGMTSDEWITAYYGQDGVASPDPCTPIPTDLGISTVGGHPATVAVYPDTPTCGGNQAYVRIDDTMYVFSVWLSRVEPLFKAFVSTVEFTP